MNTREIISTWKWRVVKAGYNQKNFAKLLGISPSLFTEYQKGKKDPSLERFDLIENKLKTLGV